MAVRWLLFDQILFLQIGLINGGPFALDGVAQSVFLQGGHVEAIGRALLQACGLVAGAGSGLYQLVGAGADLLVDLVARRAADRFPLQRGCRGRPLFAGPGRRVQGLPADALFRAVFLDLCRGRRRVNGQIGSSLHGIIQLQVASADHGGQACAALKSTALYFSIIGRDCNGLQGRAVIKCFCRNHIGSSRKLYRSQILAKSENDQSHLGYRIRYGNRLQSAFAERRLTNVFQTGRQLDGFQRCTTFKSGAVDAGDLGMNHHVGKRRAVAEHGRRDFCHLRRDGEVSQRCAAVKQGPFRRS